MTLHLSGGCGVSLACVGVPQAACHHVTYIQLSVLLLSVLCCCCGAGGLLLMLLFGSYCWGYRAAGIVGPGGHSLLATMLPLQIARFSLLL
jgi:hypothetical protein